MDYQAILKEAGPFTAPLCAAMGYAIRWLLKDRARLLQVLSASSSRERATSAIHTTEAIESARLMAESNQSLRDHDRVLERLIDLIKDRWGSS